VIWLIDEIEQGLAPLVDSGMITEDDAAHRIVQFTEAATDLVGALKMIRNRHMLRYARSAAERLRDGRGGSGV
jgi:hypothetical protein